jgi:hypothetical protein
MMTGDMMQAGLNERIWVFALVICGGLCSVAGAGTAKGYIASGRTELFRRTLPGVENAYRIFETALGDADCSDCAKSRELVFLHALSKTILLFVDHNDVVTSGSLFELAEAFGVVFHGVAIDKLTVDWPVDMNECYKVPPDADPNQIVRTLRDAILPQVKEIIEELDSIEDSPTRFRMYFTPEETGLKTDLEVDYGDLLVLKGLLLAYQGLLEVRLAYDLHVEVDLGLIEEDLADQRFCPRQFSEVGVATLFRAADPNHPSVNKDFLRKYPHLLKVLPTPNDANDGAAILAQARNNVIDALTYGLDALDYIASEDDPAGTDPQEDELLYLDRDSRPYAKLIRERLTTLRDSLKNRTAGTYTLENTIYYEMYDSRETPVGQLALVFGVGGQQGNEGWLDLADGTRLNVDRWSLSGTNALTIELSSTFGEMQGWFEGRMNPLRTSISEGVFEYWGMDTGTVDGITGQSNGERMWAVTVDPRPVFGPSPVNPRDLLPLYTDDNEIVPGTFGHGLGDDPTLGGILPGWRQKDWSELFEIPPQGSGPGQN